MPVSVVCPSCDMEQTADAPGGTIQCRTCWAKVSVPSVTTDTPPPAGDFPAAREGEPPRAKRAQPPERAARVNRPEKPKAKPEGWVGAAVLLMAVLVVGAAAVVFMWPVAEPTAATTSTPSQRERPTEWVVEWQQYDTGGGAKLIAPGLLDKEEIAVRDGTATRPGQRFTATDADGNTGEVFSFRKADRADRDALVASFMEVPAVNVKRVGVRAIRGGDATEYAGTGDDGFDHTALVIGRDGVWHVFHQKVKRGTDTQDRRKEQFVAKAEVTWTRPADPDPAPPKPVKPKDPPRPADPKPNDPPKATDSKSEAEPITEPWAAIDNQAGFAAVAPKGVKSEKLIVPLNRLPLGGQKWQTEDAHCLYHLSYLDLPAEYEPDLQKLVKPLLGFGDSIAGSEGGRVDGRKATLWDLWKWDKQKAKGVTVACGFRLFTAFVSSKQGKGYGDDATFTRRTDKFLNSLAFTFDPKADDPYPGEAKWSAVENTAGFRATMPTTTVVKEYGVGFPRILGRQYRAEAGGIAYVVSVHEVPANRTPAEVVKGVLGHDKVVAGPVEVKGTDRKWAAYELGSPERPVLVRTVTVGKRVYSLRTHPEPSGDERAGAREFRDKSARFFDSVTVDE